MIMIDLNIDLSEKLSFKYSNGVPKGYDVSQIQYTFDFIDLVLKRDSSIDDAIKGVSNEYGLSENYLKDYLIENKYVLNKGNNEDISQKLKTYNTKTLKKMLKKHGLKASGKRKKIEERIIENNLFGNNYYLSSKSKVFHKNKKRRIRIFNKFLSQYYYFNEFNEYYMDNYRKKEEKIPIEFINQHLIKSIENKNHRLFTLNNQVLVELYYEKENNKKMLEHVLKNFCINLNPVWKIDDLKNHGGIPKRTYDYLILLNDKIGRNRIITAYFVVWDSFNFEKVIVSKYTGYRYLKDILNLKSIYKINEDLESKFYSNSNLKIKKIIQKTLFDF